MIFVGNSEQLKMYLDILLIIFGQDAKIADIENIIILAAILYPYFKDGQLKNFEVA